VKVETEEVAMNIAEKRYYFGRVTDPCEIKGSCPLTLDGVVLAQIVDVAHEPWSVDMESSHITAGHESQN
jgi:hypothetical protein